jgi:RNA polymerase sigma-70 factor (ECF subfamily)
MFQVPCFPLPYLYNGLDKRVGASVEFHLFDAEYVRKLTSGDAATESHFSAYFGKFILTKLRARRVSTEMAEDICQETMLRVLKKLRLGEGVSQPERFGAFVNSVCNNVLLEFLHKESRHPPVEEDTPEPVDCGVHIDVALVTAERKKLVLDVLNELPAKDRQILRMVFFEEADRHLIAETFKVDPDYLRVLLHRAKSKFHTAYARKDRTVQRIVALFILCNAVALKFTIK